MKRSVESHRSSSECDSQGVSSGNESERSAISVNIPDCANNWTSRVFPSLRVTQKSNISFNPYDIFGKREERSTRSDPRHRAKLGCFQIAVKALIDFEALSIDDLTPHQLEESYKTVNSLKLCLDLEEWVDIMYTFKTEIYCLCCRIQERVQQFLSQLLYMVHRRKTGNEDSLSEGMFQELFTRYTKIFGLEVMCVPNIPAYELKIGSTKVIVEPNALVVDPTHDNAVLAVIEVNKKYSREGDEQSIRNFRKSGKRVQTNHINSSLKGQHLAEMLAVLPQSAFYSKKKRLYGFVIQGTEVTVTSFSVLIEGYLEDLKEGRLIPENCAEMKYSTSCNILSQQGRLGLLSTLVEMSAVSRSHI